MTGFWGGYSQGIIQMKLNLELISQVITAARYVKLCAGWGIGVFMIIIRNKSEKAIFLIVRCGVRTKIKSRNPT